MAKSKVKKPVPKPPENAKTVIEIRKEIAARKEKLAKRKQDATKDGKLNKFDAKYRVALKRVKRAQRKLVSEAYRLRPRKAAPEGAPVAAAAAAAEPAPAAAPAEGEKK
jgi:hypothetical protein